MGFSKVSARSQPDIRKISIAQLRSLDHGYVVRALCLLLSFQMPVTARRTLASMMAAVRGHPLPVFLGFALVAFMKLEYTVDMVMPGMEPRDLGFHFTAWVHHMLANHPFLNSVLAAGNTGFVVFLTAYILWMLFVDRRNRPAVAALFMYTLRAFLGYATQLPVPQEFLGSGLDFPVNNASFFLFFSGHVAASVIVSMDMRRTHRHDFGSLVEILNLLQSLRLLATRGHYTIDLAIGAGAGWACYLLAGKYEEIQQKVEVSVNGSNAKNRVIR